LRRHLANCPACENVVEALARGRRLAAGLPIIAMDDDARESLIDRVGTKSDALLPSHEQVLRVVDEDHDPGPAVSPVIGVVALVLALALGVAIAVVSRSGHGTPDTLSGQTGPPLPAPSNSLVPKATPKHHKASPSATPSLTPSATASATVSASSSASTSPTATAKTTYDPVVVLSPTSGRSGTTVTVVGTGWPPGTTVTFRYAGQARGGTTVNSQGNFHGQLAARSLLPGQRTVDVSDGKYSATATFNQTL
jgi:cytoskeletal protein RodZ